MSGPRLSWGFLPGLLSVPLLLLLCLQVSHAAAPWPSIDPERAAHVFAEAEEMCRADGGALWGVSLCGPLILVDPETRTVVASEPDGEGRLEVRDGVHVGTLPRDVPVANTAVSWAGVRWAMLMWPLPEDGMSRRSLVAHELWHRIQDELGLPATDPTNAHLEEREARILLRLEWRALARSLSGDGEAMPASPHGEALPEFLEDALAFRAYRHRLFPEGGREETLLEVHEGLAEYTGIALGADSRETAVEAAKAALRSAEDRPTFARSFAYATGPAYGLVLDRLDAPWRERIRAERGPADLLAELAGFRLPEKSDLSDEEIREAIQEAIAVRGDRYGGERIREEEEARAREREERLGLHRARLVDGPVLLLPPGDPPRIMFHPHQVEPLAGVGTVYGSARVLADWGVLEAPGGLLLRDEDGMVAVPAPSGPRGERLEGEGWTLELEGGWRVVPGERPGDWRVVKE